MYQNPDQLEFIYEGNIIFSTKNGLVSGSDTITVDIDGEEERIFVKMTAPNPGTGWDFSISCLIPPSVAPSAAPS